jgi:hypothetical protein
MESLLLPRRCHPQILTMSIQKISKHAFPSASRCCHKGYYQCGSGTEVDLFALVPLPPPNGAPWQTDHNHNYQAKQRNEVPPSLLPTEW